MVATWYHYRVEEMKVTVFLSKSAVRQPPTVATLGMAMKSCEVGGTEVERGDYRGKLGTSRTIICMYYCLWMIMYMAKVVLGSSS